MLRGDASYHKGDRDKALSDYAEAIRLAPGPMGAEILIRRAAVFASEEISRRRWRTTMRRSGSIPGTPPCSRAAAPLYARQGNHAKALADLNEAIRLDPKAPHAYLQRAGCYYNRRDFDRALADANEAIRLDPKDADAFVCRAACFQARQEPTKAIADLDEAIRLNPRHVTALARRAELRAGTPDAEKGLADLTRAIQLDPKNPVTLLTRAKLHSAKAALQ